ncbi:hypothetical protein [Streptomyces shaanxiensis]|uniref:Uncharacterized protein n=1 Tax=Streptomyces shaanxiensis TaxID=653357 RepID=A0ABP7U9N9_9ACTN
MTEARRRLGLDRIMQPLKVNMPEAGDFGFEAIRRLGNPVPMLVQNGGARPL